MVDTEMILQAIEGLKNEVAGMKGEMAGMKSEMADMKGEMSSMKSDIDTMKGDIKKVNEKVTRLEIIIENDIKPDIKKLSEHQLGLREQLEEYKAQVDDRLGTSDLVNLLADYSKKHC